MNASSWFSILAVPALAALAACQPGDPALDTAAAKTGSLGNGDFYFSCDDSVTCASYTNVAGKFPDAVAEGASFHIQYAPKDSGIHINESQPGQGYTIQAAGKNTYLSLGVDGFTPVKDGIGTIEVITNGGHVVDFTALKIAKPDAIVVYEDGFSGSGSPPPVTTITMNVGDSKTFRTLARQKQADLAGVFESDWASADTSIVSAGTRNGGKTTIQAVKAGTTTMTVTGAALTQTITVQVAGVTQ